MHLDELTISQFRCWDYTEFEFPSSFSYIKGPNGSGKTSILEAVGFLSNGRSFRTHRDRECVQHDRSSFSLRGTFSNAEFTTVSMEYQKGGESGKRVKIDGDTIPRLSILRKTVFTIQFSSSDILTLKEGPSLRRQFMNEILSRTSEGYLKDLKDYQNALKQRNSLLKEHSPDPVLLNTVEESLAETGETVLSSRERLWPELEPLLRTEYLALETGDPSQLTVQYDPGVDNPEQFLEELRDERDRAQQRGFTTIGPQRADWMFHLEGRSVDRYSSQGEIRTLVFALKFASAQHILNETGKRPILLFDDMVSDLDKNRIKSSLERAQSKVFQLIFTGTRSLSTESVLDSCDEISLRAGSI